MRAIIFFVPFGKASEENIKDAKLISESSGERVVFRNGSLAAQYDEVPEPALGYAGLVPDLEGYKGKTIYGVANGKVAKGEAPEPEDKPELNKLGLPIGSPETREELKEALNEADIEFHGNAKTAILAELYSSEILVLEGSE